MEYRQDKERTTGIDTGIYVRALNPQGHYISADIASLTIESLVHWLRSREGKNAWAERTVCILLGYDLTNKEELFA